MSSLLQQSLRVVTACILVTIFAVPQDLVAQAHLVSPADLERQLLAQSQTRQTNFQVIQRFLSLPAAERALGSLHVNRAKVTSALSSLSDEELARLAARAQKAQADFAAGDINDHDLLIILVASLALILIIVAVRH
ncbi:MAG: hypothetical protein JO249_00115 [Acidobacteria bacterium]|nr:hypothetical protein [Acidobacteriota bacterium]MBV9479146.1 hypothetical protein [Acidobacteriota bacterium]